MAGPQRETANQTRPARRRWGDPPAGGVRAADPAPYGWAPLLVLFSVGLIDRVEHALLGGLLPLIQAEWAVSDAAAGSIPTAAAIASALLAIPAGYLADRRSRTRIIAVVVFVWALATLGSGLAVGFAMLYAMRVLLAAAEQIDNPAASSLLADYYPPANRPKVYGLVRMTTYLGGIGLILAGLLGEIAGWRLAFAVMAVPGLIGALLVLRLREPRRGHIDAVIARAEAEDELGAGPGGGGAASGRSGPVTGAAARGQRAAGPDAADPAAPAPAAPPFAQQAADVLRTPTLVLLSVGLMLLTAGITGIHFWLPSLISRDFGAGVGLAGTVSGATSVFGVVLGTLIGSWLGRRVHGALRGGRVLVGGLGVVAGSIGLGLAVTADTLPVLAAALALASTLSSIAIPCITASVADVVGAESRGIGFAFLNFLLTAGGAAGPLAVGAASDATGSLVAGFWWLIGPMAAGGLLMAACRRTFERDARKVLDAARGAQ
ncbi:MFS transporter [Nocardiopsis coralliicola]